MRHATMLTHGETRLVLTIIGVVLVLSFVFAVLDQRSGSVRQGGIPAAVKP